MFKQLASMASLMKEAHRIPEIMQRVQNQLQHENVVGEAGSGAVLITVNGLGETQAVNVVPALLSCGDATMVEQLLKEAFNSANQQARQRLATVMQRAASELNLQLPGMNELIEQMAGSTKTEISRP
jgi:DNA-binding YbaB/EbfC family protein